MNKTIHNKEQLKWILMKLKIIYIYIYIYIYIDSSKDINDKDPIFKVDDHVFPNTKSFLPKDERIHSKLVWRSFGN